ncbi:hypothetical protein [Pandoraea iniqua]|nr:hypothetical protein [Pandoraea iniqua]
MTLRDVQGLAHLVGRQALGEFLQLTKLVLDNIHLSTQSAPLRPPHSLRELEVVFCTGIPEAWANQLRELSQLTSLRLIKCSTGKFEGSQELLCGKWFDGLVNHAAISTLIIEEALIDPSAAKAISTLPSLQSLELNDCHVNEEGMLAMTPIFPQLRALVIRYGVVGDEGARTLGASLQRVESLELSAVELTDANVAALAPLAQLPNFHSLDLAANSVGDEGAQMLAAFTYLRNLDLPGNNIGDMGAQALATMTHLHRLDLTENDAVGDLGLDALKALEPNTSWII